MIFGFRDKLAFILVNPPLQISGHFAKKGGCRGRRSGTSLKYDYIDLIEHLSKIWCHSHSCNNLGQYRS